MSLCKLPFAVRTIRSIGENSGRYCVVVSNPPVRSPRDESSSSSSLPFWTIFLPKKHLVTEWLIHGGFGRHWRRTKPIAPSIRMSSLGWRTSAQVELQESLLRVLGRGAKFLVLFRNLFFGIKGAVCAHFRLFLRLTRKPLWKVVWSQKKIPVERARGARGGVEKRVNTWNN